MIPCYITIRDLHTWPAAMLPHIERFGLRPVLCDHGSTYGPCLHWLDACEAAGIEVQHFGNDGCYGFWRRKADRSIPDPGWYVVSDSDLDLAGIPDDVVTVMQRSFAANPWAYKVGVSLEIDDIPADIPTRPQTLAWETKYWRERSPDGHWIAGVGATLALYHRDRETVDSASTKAFYRAVRLDRPYTARHLPWYVRPGAITGEHRYYLDRIDGLPVYSQQLRRAAQ